MGMCAMTVCLHAQEETVNKPSKPGFVREKFGKTYEISDHIKLYHIARHQAYNRSDSLTYDKDVRSPKSVTLDPQGTCYYVNSLEGFKTVVYDAETHQKVATIPHTFTDADSLLWAEPSGLYTFDYEYEHPNTFSGKPVEATFTHQGRYLWVPYYRRNYDLNAQDPSAMAVIDTQSHQIIRLFETGALPKMVEASADGKWVAVSHWGENTVGLIDVSSPSPTQWHYVKNFIVDHKLELKLSRTVPVNRDTNSGFCLRGTVFTPDGRYLLVGCMGGTGGIAVIDLWTQSYLGRIQGMMRNVRHLLIHNEWLYLSINKSGYVQRIRLEKLLAALPQMEKQTVKVEGWESCKVAAGARTISITPDGQYIFAACNFGSSLCVVDTRTMKMIGSAPVDSYPVGLDIAPDGRTVYVTSQGRSNGGGNAVNVFEIVIDN